MQITVVDVTGIEHSLDISSPTNREEARRMVARGAKIKSNPNATVAETSAAIELYNSLYEEGSPSATYAFRTADGEFRYYDIGQSEEREAARKLYREGGTLIQPNLGPYRDELTQRTLEVDTFLTQEISNQAIEPSEVETRQDILEDLGKTEQDFGVQSGSEVLNWPQEARANAARKLESNVEEVIDGELLEPSESDRFSFVYKNMMGEEREWRFSLMPAIDNPLNLPRGSGMKVPEVKPGLMVNTVMKHKNIIIPGGLPIVQTIGPEMMLVQLVGAFIGNEGNVGRSEFLFDDRNTSALDSLATIPAGESALYATWGVERPDIQQLDSYERAKEFNTEVVLQGAPVVMQVMSAKDNNPSGERRGINFTYKGVISTFKLYAVRQDRTYWSISLLVTEYGIEGKYKNALEEDRGKLKLAAEEAAKERASEEAGGEDEDGDQEPSAAGNEDETLTNGSQKGDTNNLSAIDLQKVTTEGSSEGLESLRERQIYPSLSITEASREYGSRFGGNR